VSNWRERLNKKRLRCEKKGHKFDKNPLARKCKRCGRKEMMWPAGKVVDGKWVNL